MTKCDILDVRSSKSRGSRFPKGHTSGLGQPMTFKPGLVCLLVLGLGLQAKAKAAQETMCYQT